VWYTALVSCAFCGVEGEEVKGPVSPAKLNLAHGGVASGPPPESKASEPPAAPIPPASEPKPAPPADAAPAKVEASAPPAAPEKPPPVSEAPQPERAAPPRPATGRLAAVLPLPSDATAPAPRIPSAVVPLVFAGLGTLACAILPGTAILRHDRVAEILALLSFAVLSPFAPFAWLAGQRYSDRCRALGFAPASAARTGKILGVLASFLLVFEISALSVWIAVQGLSGKVVCPLWK
jgi:hypothetical protein